MPLPTDAREDAIWRRLLRRIFTQAGAKADLAVTAAATTVTWSFDRMEPDANYGAVATPNWATTVHVSARSTSGLTLTFGTAAPANAVVHILTFRTA